MIDVSRLLSQLQTTGLQNKDTPLYQVIQQLIMALSDLTGSVTTIISNPTPGVPGPAGPPIGLLAGFGDDLRELSEPTIIISETIGSNNTQTGIEQVPYFIATGDTFIIPLYKQALFSMNIDNEGTIQLDGFLIEVD